MARTALMYMSYDLSHYLDGDISRSTSFTVSDDDAINCAHMLAAGFNTLSRKLMGDFVLAVVDTKAGTVQYDGKIEKIKRDDPWSVSQSFTFEPSADTDTIVTLFGEAGDRIVYPGKLSFVKDDEASEELHKLGAAHIARPVLEDAYVELESVKAALETVGVETIPASKGVRTLIRRLDHEEHARQAYEEANGQANEAARAELIDHVKRAYAKWGEVDPGRQRESLKAHLRGMLEVLSKFLAATGEADADERHAVALRVCEIPEGNYLYDDT